jgi:hypothetical protein
MTRYSPSRYLCLKAMPMQRYTSFTIAIVDGCRLRTLLLLGSSLAPIGDTPRATAGSPHGDERRDVFIHIPTLTPRRRSSTKA